MSDEPDYTNIRLTAPPRRVEPMPLPSDAPRLWQTLWNVAALCSEIEKLAILDDGAERDARLRLIALAAKGLTLEVGDLTTVTFPDQTGNSPDAEA